MISTISTTSPNSIPAAPVRVALLQMTTGTDPISSARVLEDRIADAAARGASVVFTPECTNMMNRDRNALWERAVTESEDPCFRAASAAARKHGITVMVGSLLVRSPGEERLRNRALVFGPDGGTVARYDKIHMFDVDLASGESHRESESVCSGDQAVLVDLGWAKVGLAICYDLRFAVLHRLLAQGGASVLSIPAAFTVPTGQAHWHVLQRARAIETGCFVVAAAQVGEHEGKRSTYGHSLVVDPWGKVIADAGFESDATLVVDMDMGQVERARQQVPSLNHDQAISGGLSQAVGGAFIRKSEMRQGEDVSAGVLSRVSLWPVWLYRYAISPCLPSVCRFEPTCSAYAVQAVHRHGFFRGWWLAVRRLLRCHPWGGSGYDPIPH